MTVIKNNLSVFSNGDPANQPVIFVHGFPFDHNMWHNQINDLSRNYFCVSYDIRGLGDSPAGDGQYTDGEIENALAAVGLGGYEDLPSHTLSAGQQRRVNLARLYLSGARLWLLDEPFTAIDRDGVAALQQLIVSRVASGGAVVLSSHQALQVSWEVRHLELTVSGER